MVKHDFEIFRTGNHNGRDFTLADLQAIVADFAAQNSGGRVPIVIGHKSDDSAPARGWIDSIYLQGDAIRAAARVDADLYGQIKAGAFRFCSVELTKAAGGGWSLDRVGVLGAVRPGVKNLAPLMAARSAGAQRLCFTASLIEEGDRATMIEQEAAAAIIEAHIDAGRLLPRERVQFAAKTLPEERTIAAAKAWAQAHRIPDSARRNEGRPTSMARLDDDQLRFAQDAGALLAEKHEAICREHGLDMANPQQFDRGMRLTFKRHPELARAWAASPGEI